MQGLKSIGAYGTVGLDLAVSIAIGLAGGYWLDRKFETSPWFQVAGVIFGAAVGFNLLYKAAARMQRETSDEDSAKSVRESERKNH